MLGGWVTPRAHSLKTVKMGQRLSGRYRQERQADCITGSEGEASRAAQQAGGDQGTVGATGRVASAK